MATADTPAAPDLNALENDIGDLIVSASDGDITALVYVPREAEPKDVQDVARQLQDETSRVLHNIVPATPASGGGPDAE